MKECRCGRRHEQRRIVLTGGPGAGKTAVLELVRQEFCRHVSVLPEAAGIVFGGGFPRLSDPHARRAAQRAICYVQRELERLDDPANLAIVLCDRGTVDGAVYWPGPGDFWTELETTPEREMSRYDVVIHLRTPRPGAGYNNQRNSLRTETPEAALAIDAALLEIWARHPRRFVVPPASDFLEKATRTIESLRREMPGCCGGTYESAVGG